VIFTFIVVNNLKMLMISK